MVEILGSSVGMFGKVKEEIDRMMVRRGISLNSHHPFIYTFQKTPVPPIRTFHGLHAHHGYKSSSNSA
jgi:hypothetical protein